MATTQKTLFPPPAVDLLTLLQPEAREKREKQSHYASELEGCIRKLFYKWIGAPETNPTSEASLKKMEAGNDAHELFGMKLSRKAEIIDIERSVELVHPDLVFPIHGRIDFMARIDEQVYVIEYKSTQYRTTDRALESPFPGHVLQLVTYSRIEPADHYLLVYEDRGSKLGVQYEIIEHEGQIYWRRDNELSWTPFQIPWEAVIHKLKLVEQAVADNRPPERIDPLTGEEYKVYLSEDGKKIQQTKTVVTPEGKKIMRSHWMCMGYCPYRDYCWLGKEVADANPHH